MTSYLTSKTSSRQFRRAIERGIMEREVNISSVLLLVFLPILRISANVEVDALYIFKTNMEDPNNVLQSWDPTFANPCTWFHVTCNLNNSVSRVDLANAALSGQLVPQLGLLKSLLYLELHHNNISGQIPFELGSLSSLVSLDLYQNSLTGPIPDTFSRLSKLRILRLNNNNLTGVIPMSLTNLPSLQVLDLSSNRLSGRVPDNGSFLRFTPLSFANNLDLYGPVAGCPCADSLPFSPPPPLPLPIFSQG